MTTLNDQKYRIFRSLSANGARNDFELQYVDRLLAGPSETNDINDRWRQLFTELGQKSVVRNDAMLEWFKIQLVADDQINDAELTFYRAAE